MNEVNILDFFLWGLIFGLPIIIIQFITGISIGDIFNYIRDKRQDG